MPSRITNPVSHRTRIVSEAVMSAYIREIAQPPPPRESPWQSRRHTRTIASNRAHMRARSHALAPPRQRPRELAA